MIGKLLAQASSDLETKLSPDGFPSEMLGDKTLTGFAVTPAFFGIQKQIDQCVGKSVNVAGRNDPPGLVVENDIFERADTGDDNRDALSKCFEDDDAVGLISAGQAKHRCLRDEAGNIFQWHPPDDFDLRMSELGHGASNAQPCLGHPGHDLLEGLDKIGAAFACPIEAEKNDRPIFVVVVFQWDWCGVGMTAGVNTTNSLGWNVILLD